jgi:Na+/H+ antiporter NhaC
MKPKSLPFIILFLISSSVFTPSFPQERQVQPASFKIDVPQVVLKNITFSLKITALDSSGQVLRTFSDTVAVAGILTKSGNGTQSVRLLGPFRNGRYVLENAVVARTGRMSVRVAYGAIQSEQGFRSIPGLLSILPPVLAIVLALLLRQVLLSLFFGIWLGAAFLSSYNPLVGLMRALDHYVVGSLGDPDHAAIAIFSLLLGGMVGIISQAGGTAGIVQAISRFASSFRGGQLATWAMGLFIFFDDYANTLVVGNTMRPFTDRLRISREKLSYIVDSTAAPVASIAIISTWVGFQVGLIQSAFENLGIVRDAYITFLQSITYSFYSIMAIFTVFFIAFTERDFGAMLTAERRSQRTGQVLRPGAIPLADTKALESMSQKKEIPLRWANAVIPILVMILVSFAGLYYSGLQSLGERATTARFGEIIGSADSFAALMWGTTVGVFIAGGMAISQKILNLSEVMEAWLSGIRAMVLAIVILVLAWAIGNICNDLHTADYIVQTTRGLFTPHLLPALTFVVAALTSFSTGTSWATMAILTPLVVPLAHHMPAESGMNPEVANTILIGTIGAVLSGSVFGDHCSPISDTTIMSSMASGADHIDHVRTQIPYAILAATVAFAVGYVPAGYGIHPVISIPAGAVLILLLITFLGKKVRTASNPG